MASDEKAVAYSTSRTSPTCGVQSHGHDGGAKDQGGIHGAVCGFRPWRVAYSRLASQVQREKGQQKGLGAWPDCSGRYFSTPQAVATPKVATKPSRFSARQALHPGHR
jgi:hypothetical protein